MRMLKCVGPNLQMEAAPKGSRADPAVARFEDRHQDRILGLGDYSEGLLWWEKERMSLSRGREGGEWPRKSPSSPSFLEFQRLLVQLPNCMGWGSSASQRKEGARAPAHSWGTGGCCLRKGGSSSHPSQSHCGKVKTSLSCHPTRGSLGPLAPKFTCLSLIINDVENFSCVC